jgi:hypothetical protein
VAITNGATANRYLMVSAFECEALQVERLGESGYETVAQSVGFQCGCECAGPLPPGPNELRLIAPDETTEISWDAREIDACTETVDCLETYGFEGTASMTYGVRVPAPSGEYRLTYQLFESLPAHCVELANGIFCDNNSSDVVTTGCEGDLVAEVPVSLPTTGDVTAPITVD